MDKNKKLIKKAYITPKGFAECIDTIFSNNVDKIAHYFGVKADRDNISVAPMTNEELDRLNQLKAMHMLMGVSKNDSIYDQWVDVFTDVPGHYDFEEVARDEERFLACYGKFCELIGDDRYLDSKERAGLEGVYHER